MAVRIGVVGDVHLRFDAEDAAGIDAQGYDLVLFVGDLAGYRQRGGLGVAREVARLRTPTIVLPGNHDGPNLLELASEVFPALSGFRPLLGRGQKARCEALDSALGPARLVGYQLCQEERFTVLAARPHSCGGPQLAFPTYLRGAFGVRTMKESAERLRGLVDEVPWDRPLIILAHNGPTGLGEGPTDFCGRDFHPDAGDWGDPDLRVAIDHALAQGRPLRAVVTGHMHHKVRGGGRRTWLLERDGVLHVNAARVPRIFREGGRLRRHHVALTLDEGRARAEEVLL